MTTVEQNLAEIRARIAEAAARAGRAAAEVDLVAVSKPFPPTPCVKHGTRVRRSSARAACRRPSRKFPSCPARCAGTSSGISKKTRSAARCHSSSFPRRRLPRTRARYRPHRRRGRSFPARAARGECSRRSSKFAFAPTRWSAISMRCSHCPRLRSRAS